MLIESLAAAASNDITGALQKGLFEEEANQNLPAAIEAYQSVIQKLDENRKLAATAVFRLGECYRKLGRTNEAAAQYQRVLREFKDQSLLTSLSEQNLGILLPGQAARSSPETNQEPVLSVEALEIQKLRSTLKDSPDLINAPSPGGLTLLQAAAQSGKLEVAEFLLQHGAEVNLGNQGGGDTALHFATTMGHRAMVGLLLRSRADVNSVNKARQTPLHQAARNGFKAVAELLLKEGADVNAKDEKGETPLHEAVDNKQSLMVELLLTNRADVNATTAQGVTALTKAVQARSLAIVNQLLEKKADPNAGSVPQKPVSNPGQPAPYIFWVERNYPVHLAVTRNDTAILKSLLAAGADPNKPVYGRYHQSVAGIGSLQDMDGWTPLMIAIQEDKKEMAALLLDYKADPNLSFETEKPLLQAISHPEIAQILVDRGADVNVQDHELLTPLHWAVSRGQKSLIEAMLKKNAQVDAKDANGRTPLHFAMKPSSSSSEPIELLLAAGADANARTLTSDTPLHFAVQNLNLKAVELLVAAKADVNARNNQGMTPLRMISPVQPNAPAAALEIAEMLRSRGGLDDLARDDQIVIRRNADNYSNVIFVKGTNDLNRFTLFEAIAVQYGLIARSSSSFQTPIHRVLPGSYGVPTASQGLGFPDFQRVVVRGARSMDVRVPDCSQDTALSWGTVIEIPEADHPINAVWQGLSSNFVAKLTECLEREITLTVKGQTTNLVLRPRIDGRNVQFYLRPVLMDSGLIRTSSDLSRVKVKRRDYATGGAYELTFDCSQDASPGFIPPTSSATSHDLWLLHGDVIEVPDKP